MKSTLYKDTRSPLADLRKLIDGDVLDDQLSRVMFSSGACLYRVRPLGVVQPRNKADVIAVVQYAAQEGIAIIPRGAGTSRTGSELGTGIILDFSKYMNEILELDSDGHWVRVQPGIILAKLNDLLRPHNVFFPIDPSTMEFCTIGGMVANNSSGPHAVKYGTTRNHVQSLEVILSSGEVVNTDPVPIRARQSKIVTNAESHAERIYGVLPELLRQYRGPLKKERPFTMKNSSGYDLWNLRRGNSIDFTPLLVGSEGTLGIITEARLALTGITGKALSGLLYFDDLENVGKATQSILKLSPSMLEIMEKQILDLARAQSAELRPYLPEGIEGVLYVEFQEDDEEVCRSRFRKVKEKIVQQERLATNLMVAANEADMAVFAKVRSMSGPILNKIRGSRRPLAFIEDTAVHPSRLTHYMKGLRKLFQKFNVEASVYGHAGDGNLHIMVFMDLSREDEVRKMMALTDACYDLVLSLDGTISAEHGDGRLRSYYLKKQYPNLYPAMVEVKKLFDPENIFNPGCIVGVESNPLGQNLKFHSNLRGVSTDSVFDKEWARAEIETCSGCGKCRSYCPIARQIQEEWAMGRGKATLLREIISGNMNPNILESFELKKVMDSCVNCKRCLQECPSGVDIPWLALSGKAHYVVKHGDTLGNRFLSDAQLLGRLGSAFAPLVNRANASPTFRRFLEKAVGIDRRRYLPPFHRRAPRKSPSRVQPSGNREIVYFLDCFGKFNESARNGSATAAVLQHNGFLVLTPDFRCCGIGRISAGSGDAAMDDIQANVKKMASYAEQGLDIIFDEPSCALAVKLEYPKLLNSDNAEKVASRCFDIHQYLMMLHHQGKLNLNLREMHLTVGYHNPCHLRALGVTREPAELLQLIPGVTVQVFSDECCGLAGTYGMKRKNFDISMGIGTNLFDQINDSGVDEIATSCAACKLQIMQGTNKEPLTPISLLARAYENQ